MLSSATAGKNLKIIAENILMPSLRFSSMVATLSSALILIGSSAWAIDPTHIYELNNSLADSLGGPSLVNNGATLGATGLTFGANQGPSLSNAIDPANYSIEAYFQITSVGGYRKLIDFKDHSSDNGLYNLNTGLNFYNVATGSAGTISANTMTHLVLTRDGGTQLVTGYINGISQLSFTDSGTIGTFSAANNIIQFFQDDTVTGGGESSSGFVDFVRIYDAPLTATDVADRYAAVSSVVPEASPLLLMGIALPFAGLLIRRRAVAI